MRELSLSDINTDTLHLRSWLEYVRPATEGDPERLCKVRRLLRIIPPVERDIIELHFFAEKQQDQIGAALGLTQQAVSHRMQRACERLAFLLDHPRPALWEVRRDLGRVWPEAPALMPQLLAEFVRTSSQTETAERLGVSTQRVRQHLEIASAYFGGCKSRIADRYAAMLARLLTHRSILCEVPVPRRDHEVRSPRPRRRASGRVAAAGVAATV